MLSKSFSWKLINNTKKAKRKKDKLTEKTAKGGNLLSGRQKCGEFCNSSGKDLDKVFRQSKSRIGYLY